MRHAGQAEQIRMEPWSRGSDRGAQITFTGFDKLPITVVCTVFTRESDGLVHWGLEASLPPDVTLEAVSYPVMAVGPTLAAAENGAAVVGSAKGGIHRWSQWKEGETRQFEQPGSLVAGFGCCYDDAGGVHTAACDPKGYRKTLFFQRTKGRLDWGWRHPCLCQQRFTLPYDIVLGSFTSSESDRSADWRDAADIYKAWAVKQPWCRQTFAERNGLPEWLKQGPIRRSGRAASWTSRCPRERPCCA